MIAGSKPVNLTPPASSGESTGRKKHLLDFQDWSVADIHALFDTTDVMAQVLERTIKRVPALQGFTVGTLFFENSTRTRLSFERAARAQSADVLSFAAGASSLSKGESMKDTLRTIDQMQSDVYVVRHVAAGVPYQLTKWTDASIINAGDGRRAHPTQALLDAYTFKKNFANFDHFEGKRLAIVGDVMHSRVARSNIELWTLLGGEVTLCGPATLLPRELEQFDKVTLTHNVYEAAEGAHAVMALRLQNERMTSGLLPSIAEYQERYQVTEKVMAEAHPDALVMHPGPMNRDVEIAGDLADSERSVIEKQVASGVPIRMAVLYTLLVGKK
ncbi:MAG: aspartate carbamoyltransferase catalytic subunit [Trueperaceae bacterium]|nr:aspartate carbamoyltransferase catalytic subunit [Trueperaceae bacterium]